MLRSYFSSLQLYLIEAAFERTTRHARDDSIFAHENNRDALDRAVDFGFTGWCAIETSEELLKRIMTNIIENNGEFVP